MRTRKYIKWGRTDLLYWNELNRDEQLELNGTEDENSELATRYFRYENHVYTLEDFLSFNAVSPCPHKRLFDGYLGDSYFSAIVIKLDKYCEGVLVATIIS